MFRIFKWLSNLWNLRLIFDKYLPKIKKLLETVDQQQLQIKNLRQEILDMKKVIEKLKSPLGYLDTERMAEAIVKARKTEIPMENETAKEASKWEVEQNPRPMTESRITKRNRYYDPQMGVEYFDFEVNGDKDSSEDDTEVE